ncbi:hypothetical protein SLE2022_227010 [Rubroshorea leprosula]
MPSPFSLFRKKSTTRTFKDFYAEWFDTLKNNLLPLLRQSLSSPLHTLISFRIDLLLQHFLSYYDSLDLAASSDVSYLLFPSSWRNPLEIPFLFLGDLHPYIFTNLVRSFIDEANNRGDEDDGETDGFLPSGRNQIGQNLEFLDKPWQFLVAWKNPSRSLITRIEQIECGLRLMVPELVSRVRKAQAAIMGKIAEDWVSCEGKKKEIDEAVKEEMEEMVAVFLDANRLRRTVISEIIDATNVYQGALFLEALSQFLVGFRDPILLAEFERCNMPILRFS